MSDEERAAARVRGGKATSKVDRASRLLPEKMRPVVEILEEAIKAVRDGKLEPSRGQAMAALSNALVRAYQAGTLEERVRELESQQQSMATLAEARRYSSLVSRTYTSRMCTLPTFAVVVVVQYPR